MEFLGTELYFEDLEKAKEFYAQVLGLVAAEEQPGHHLKFNSSRGFLCLEKKGVEDYPSPDKAVLFFEVPNLSEAVARVGRWRFVRIEPGWAVLHDPEGHNVLLLQAG